MSADLERQIACVRREIDMRTRVYPRWVSGGRMTQQKADAEIAAMQAVLATLVGLRDGAGNFAAWFAANYPPRTIISDPDWHAPRIYRRAVGS